MPVVAGWLVAIINQTFIFNKINVTKVYPYRCLLMAISSPTAFKTRKVSTMESVPFTLHMANDHLVNVEASFRPH